jgi:hypothetical protein
MEQETEAEEKGRGGATAEIRIRKTQHMTTSRQDLVQHYNRTSILLSFLIYFCYVNIYQNIEMNIKEISFFSCILGDLWK